MRNPQDLAPDELMTIVAALQEALYLDVESGETPVWNPDKEWDGAEICDQLAACLARFDLVPHAVTSVTPDAP